MNDAIKVAHHAFLGYVRAPSAHTLRPARRAILALPEFDPHLDLLAHCLPLLKAARYSDVIRFVDGSMPTALLSATAHALKSAALSALGDEDRARISGKLAQLAVSGIVGTGDGSENAPWSVIMVSDEYDVLNAMGKRSTEQRLLEIDGQAYDVHRTADDGTFWFRLDWTTQHVGDAH